MKKKFEVEESETIADCLERMEKEGYRPIRRIEKPIFTEQKSGSTNKYIPVRQRIIFEGVSTNSAEASDFNEK